MKEIRKIIQIDEEKCDGCGQCIPSCAEGAIEIVAGKAKVKEDKYCDGLGACLGHCPQGALAVIERTADAFDEEAVHEMLAREKAVRQPAPQSAPQPAPQTDKPLGCGCPGSNMMSFGRQSVARKAPAPCPCSGGDDETPESELTHWPVKIRLVPPHAPFLKGAELLIAADCAPVAYAGFHAEFLRGKVVMIGCPKFDDAEEYGKKLADVFRQAHPAKVTILRMEVPCCQGLTSIVARAVELSGVELPVEEVIVTRQGETRRPQEVPCHDLRGGLAKRTTL